MKKLSVIILNYKSLNLIKYCLESFEKYPPCIDYEIIIANNDDNTKDFIKFGKNYSKIKFIQNTGNWGFSSGCNLGASIAEGEYLLFLNPDTQLNETPAIDKIIDILENDIRVGISSCRTITRNGAGNEISWSSPWLLIRWIRAVYSIFNKSKNSKRFPEEENIWYPDWVGGSAVALRKNDFNKINKFSDDRYWMYWEDADICNKMKKKLGKKSALIRDHSINHIGGGCSKNTDHQALMLKMEMIISAHNYIFHNSNGIQRVTILTLYVFKNITSPIIKLALNTLLLNKKNIEKYKYITIATIQYYLKAIKRRTWRSDKLDYEKR